VSSRQATVVGREPIVGGDRPELTEASIVVSGGRGVGSADNFSVIEALPTRWVRRWARPARRRFGLLPEPVPGRADRQDGISAAVHRAGHLRAIQHRAGMQTSKTIVAVNKDAEAPIFEIADFGVVGDLFKVAPNSPTPSPSARAELVSSDEAAGAHSSVRRGGRGTQPRPPRRRSGRFGDSARSPSAAASSSPRST